MAIADKLRDSHVQAAAAQQASRNGRRVIRRLADEDETPIAVEQEPVVIEQLPAPAAVPRSTTHGVITVSPLDLPAEHFAAGLERRKQNRELLMEWLRSALVDGVDYGRIHVVSKDRCSFAKQGRLKDCGDPNHWSKNPSLFKPGAEKITGMLGMTVHYPSLPDYEQAVLNGTTLTTVMLRCELRDAQGRVVAEGVGARNLSQDYGDANKTLKMVEKSAHIDATLRLAGLSECYSQDLEDKPLVDEAPPPLQPNAENVATTATVATDTTISREELAALRQQIAKFKFSEKRVLAWLYKTTKGNVTQLDELSGKQCLTLLKRLESWAEAEKTFANAQGGNNE
ncbi:hypothetical protein DFR40_0125 [Azonexus fungiphilus]|uniref:Uncharacterized protein n=1 Tax=Azonexus fungiphilus TaxID=146940 RepID=A0A495WQM9_9RHOO|nr:hypothetical protein [Azonexus fungiphilus]RKT63075.1 hypothetical protein DFR40_0125 [Azonexus fungiphilus]